MPKRSDAGGPEGIKSGTSAKGQIRAHYEERNDNGSNDADLKMGSRRCRKRAISTTFVGVYAALHRGPEPVNSRVHKSFLFIAYHVELLQA